MKQLIAEQMLVVLHTSRETKGPERTIALRQEISDTASDEDSNELVMKERLAPDSGARSPSQVGPQRLTAAAAQIVGAMLREEQHPSAKPVLWKDAEEALVEVHAERSPGQRIRQDNVFRSVRRSSTINAATPRGRCTVAATRLANRRG